MALERVVKPHILDLEPYVPGKPIDEVKREYGIEDVINVETT